MSSNLDRLRRLQSLRPQRTRPEPTYVPVDTNGDEIIAPAVRAAELHAPLLPGDVIQTRWGECYCVTTAFPLDGARGGANLGAVLGWPPSTFAPHHPDFSLGDLASFSRAAFLDTETTGLGGGAGVYAFMIGVGVFVGGTEEQPTHFAVQQFFMRHPGEEAAALAAVAQLLNERDMVVTFNGRGFDLPLLRTRYLQYRRVLGETANAALLHINAPHLDLLAPARRLWRRRLQSCRLINLEQMILGLQRTEDDVPGSLIPALYSDYLRTGQAGAINRIFYHNREDIVSMVSLAHRLAHAYADPDAVDTAVGGLAAEDWFSLGLSYDRQGDAVRAEAAYRQALDRARDDQRRGEVYAQLAALLKRQTRWSEAAALWELWLTSVPGLDTTPYIELAKYYEWQALDLEQAEMWAAWALHNLLAATPHQRPPGRVDELEHRLARIRRKRSAGAPN